MSHQHRGVYSLRITQDSKYPNLIESCKAAMAEVSAKRPGVVKRIGCHDVYSYWKHWPCVFPQVGPGPKHLRKIELEAWQWRIAERHPRELVKGLIHSDGSRVTNRVRKVPADAMSILVPLHELLRPTSVTSSCVPAR